MKRALFIVLVLLMMGITFVPSWARLNAPTAPTAITVNIGSPTNNAVVTTSSATVSGTSTPGSTMLLTIDGGTPIPVTADAAGNWSYTATGLTQGSHTAQIQAQKEILPLRIYASQIVTPGTDVVQVIDTGSNTIIATIPLSNDEVEGLTVAPNGMSVWAAQGAGVDIIDTTTNTIVQSIPLAAGAQLARFKPDGSAVWVTQPANMNIAIINATSKVVSYFNVGHSSHDVVFRPDGRYAYVATTDSVLNGASRIIVVDTATMTIVANHTIGDANRRATMSRDGQRVYVSGKNSDSIVVIDTSTQSISQQIGVGSNLDPEGMDESLDGSRLYVVMRTPSEIWTYATTPMTRIVGETIRSTGAAPLDMPVDVIVHPINGRLYVGDRSLVNVYDTPSLAYVTGMIGTAPSSRFYEFETVRRYDRASDEVVFSVDLTSDLSLAKRHLGQNFVVGQQGQYVFTVTNAGPAAADAPITISDTLPAGLTPVAVQTPNWTSSINGQVVTLTRSAPIPANVTTQPITVTVNVGAQAVGRVTNTACVSAPNDDQPANNCGSDIVTIVPVADVSIRKTSDTQFVVGQTGTYTLTIQNNGPSISSAPITVTDTLPSGLSYLSAVGAGWQCSNTGQTFRCISSVSLAANTTATPIVVRVNVLAPAAPSVTNTAVVSTTTTDTVPSNNTSTITTPVVAIANVNIRKKSDSRFVVGQTGTYTLTVANTGPSVSVAPITVTDVLPSGLQYVSAIGTGWQCSNAGQALTCVATTALAVNATAPPIVVRVNVLTPAAPAVTNTARVTGTTPDPDPTNNISTVTTPVLVPSVAIGKVANPPSGAWIAANQLITYTLRITNTGTLTLTNLLVSDSVPQYTTYITNSAQPIPLAQTSPLRWQFAALAPGAIRTMSFVVRVQARGDITEVRNIATITSDQTPTTPSNEIVHPFDPTAINLTSFTVSHFPQRHAAWTTASEHGTAGFNLYYTFQPSFTADHRVNAYVIPATGSPTQGAAYNHLLNVRADVPLYFWLEEVEQNGTPTVYGPEVLSPMYQMFVPMISR